MTLDDSAVAADAASAIEDVMVVAMDATGEGRQRRSRFHEVLFRSPQIPILSLIRHRGR